MESGMIFPELRGDPDQPICRQPTLDCFSLSNLTTPMFTFGSSLEMTTCHILFQMGILENATWGLNTSQGSR